MDRFSIAKGDPPEEESKPSTPTTGSPDYVEPISCSMGYGDETEAQLIDRLRRTAADRAQEYARGEYIQRAQANAREIVERRNQALGLRPLPPLADRNSRHTYPRMFIRPNDSGPYIEVDVRGIDIIENAENPNMLTVGLTFQVNPDLINRILPR